MTKEEEFKKDVENTMAVGALHALAECVTTAWSPEGWKSQGQWKLDALLEVIRRLKENNGLR